MSAPNQDLAIHLWYPADATAPPSLIAQNALFHGFHAIPDAAPRPGPLPVVLLSHGSGGNAPGLGWLAAHLARAGFIVAAPNHPGTTSRDSDPFQTEKIWQRPAHLVALLDHLATTPPLGLSPDMTRIAAMGFSLGGHTALSLSGIRVGKQRFIDYCATYPDKIDCGWLNAAGVDFTAIDQALYEQSNKDARITATVAIDPALPLAILPESWGALEHPTLLINLGIPSEVPNGLRVDTLAPQLPDARFITVPGAHHFSFLAECSLFGRLVIALAGDDNICSDTGMRPRATLHGELRDDIIAFLTRALGPP